MDPRLRPWTYRYPLDVFPHVEALRTSSAETLQRATALADEAPLWWRDGAVVVARVSMEAMGLDASPASAQALVAGLLVSPWPIDLLVGAIDMHRIP